MVDDASRAHPGEPSGISRGEAAGAGGSLFGGISAVCSAAVRLTGVDGAAVALLGGSSSQARELVYATDATAQQVDELQFVVGEGPCVEAYHTGHRQIWPDLSSPEAVNRWPAFTGEVLVLGVRAVFTFPVPGVRRAVGVLELYRGLPGELAPVEQESGDACAIAVGQVLRADIDRRVADAGGVEDAVDSAATQGVLDGVDDGFSRAVVYNAAGMVAVQLAVPVDEALARLRAYCYADGRPIGEVAADIVARRLSLRDQRDSAEVQRR